MTDPLQPINPADVPKIAPAIHPDITVRKADAVPAIQPIHPGTYQPARPMEKRQPAAAPREAPADQLELSPRARSILFPIDFDEFTLRHLPYVYNFATLLNARLILLHVMPAEAAESAEADALRRLNRLVREHATPGVPVTALVEQGSVAETICRTAEALRADMIIIPTHARGRLERFILGGVTETVIRQAPCPIHVMR